jgi:hypothetical protein
VTRLDRIGTIALHAALAGIALFVVYFWMVRLGGDLSVDEAFNFRTYARNPLTAIGLYHEPNNHPLESLIKSVFFSVLGMNQPAFYRITGFLVVLGWLGLGWVAFRKLWRDGSILVGAAFVLTMLLTTAYNVRATRLRGYFMSSVWQLLWFCLLSKDTGILGRRDEATALRDDPWRGKPSRLKPALRYGLLTALFVFTVPSNLFSLPALWLLTLGAFGAGRDGLAAFVRRGFELAIAAGAFAAVLYAPIFLSLALKASVFHQLQPEETTVLGDLRVMLDQLAPRGMPPEFFGGVIAALVALGLVLRWRAWTTRLAVLAIAVTVAVRLVVAVVVGLPERARPTFIPAISFSLLVLLHDLVAAWPRRTQLFVALALVAASYGSIPALVAEDRFYRDPTETTAFLEMLGGEDASKALIVHDRMLDPIYPLQQVFGRDRIVSGRRELVERVTGVAPDPLAEGSWKKKLREMIIPRDVFPKLDLAEIRFLVVIDDVRKEGREKNPSEWIRPELDPLLARLTRYSEFPRYDLRFKVWRTPP